MHAYRHLLLTLVGAFVVTATVAGQVTPRPAPARPNDEGNTPAQGKLIAPVRGEAVLAYTQPVSKRDGTMIITTMKVKNMATGAIAGLKIDEFWYDKKGEPVTGSKSFRHRKPLMPGEVIDVRLEVPTHPQMDRNSYKFEHANGTIKPQRVPKL